MTTTPQFLDDVRMVLNAAVEFGNERAEYMEDTYAADDEYRLEVEASLVKLDAACSRLSVALRDIRDDDPVAESFVNLVLARSYRPR